MNLFLDTLKACSRLLKNTYHMRQLLKKDAEFNWTPSCQKKLDYLKECLMSDPILKLINFNRDMVILCDASIYEICN